MRGVHLGLRDMFGEPHPRLGQGEPKRLVAVILGETGHRDALFRAPAVIQRSFCPHDTYSTDATRPEWIGRVGRSRVAGVAE